MSLRYRSVCLHGQHAAVGSELDEGGSFQEASGGGHGLALRRSSCSRSSPILHTIDKQGWRNPGHCAQTATSSKRQEGSDDRAVISAGSARSGSGSFDTASRPPKTALKPETDLLGEGRGDDLAQAHYTLASAPTRPSFLISCSISCGFVW